MSFDQKWPVNVIDCSQVSLPSLKNALEHKLCDHFEKVRISIASSRDMQDSNSLLPPVSLSSGGLAIDVGGMPYFVPTFKPHKQYSLSKIEALCRSVLSDAEITLGIGAYCSTKRFAELITYKNLDTRKFETYISSTAIKNKQPICTLHEQNLFSCVGNLYASPPKSMNKQNLLRVRVKQRISNTSFVSILRRVISQSFPDQIISLGGIFTVNNSRLHCHIAPEIPPIQTFVDNEDFFRFLCYHDFDAPMTFATVFHCHDPGLQLVKEHAHGIDRNRTKVAHYWHDLDGEEVEYKAFLAVASKLVRIDMPPSEHSRFK
ncbi:ester hydrolase C11orf54 homolog [Convolutriloba macropyga]|uniref:ester hydrolase C11orf54 homolog n=1 Tax=Convolutriloba macropyga TaxID=536237 RepID=UPI003F524052